MNVFGEGIKVLVKHGELESYLESVNGDGAMICEVEPMVRGYKVSAFRSAGNVVILKAENYRKLVEGKE